MFSECTGRDVSKRTLNCCGPLTVRKAPTCPVQLYALQDLYFSLVYAG